MLNNIDYSKLNLAFKEAFKIACALAVCNMAYQFFNIDRGYWAMLTVLVIYSVPMTGLALRKSKDRIIGTTLGIIAAFLFANLLLVYDYRFSYLCFVFLIPAIFYLVIKDYYAVGAFFITILIITLITIMTPTQANLIQTMAERIFYTGIGLIVIFFAEILIFPKATQVGNQIHDISKELGDAFAQSLEYSKNFLYKPQNAAIDCDILKISEKFIARYAQIRDMYYSQLYELRYDQTQNNIYQCFFNTLDALIPALAAHYSLMRHLDLKKIKPKEVALINTNIDEALVNLQHYLSHFRQGIDSKQSCLPRQNLSMENSARYFQLNLIMLNLQKIFDILQTKTF